MCVCVRVCVWYGVGVVGTGGWESELSADVNANGTQVSLPESSFVNRHSSVSNSQFLRDTLLF